MKMVTWLKRPRVGRRRPRTRSGPPWNMAATTYQENCWDAPDTNSQPNLSVAPALESGIKASRNCFPEESSSAALTRAGHQQDDALCACLRDKEVSDMTDRSQTYFPFQIELLPQESGDDDEEGCASPQFSTTELDSESDNDVDSDTERLAKTSSTSTPYHIVRLRLRGRAQGSRSYSKLPLFVRCGLMHGCSLPQFHRGLCNGPTELPSRKKRKQEGSAQPQPFAAQRSSVSTIPQQCPHECPLLSMRSARVLQYSLIPPFSASGR